MYKTIVDFGDFTVEDTEYRRDSVIKSHPEYDVDYFENQREEKIRRRKERENDEAILSAIIAVVVPILFALLMVTHWIVFGYGGESDMWALPVLFVYFLIEFLINGSKGGRK